MFRLGNEVIMYMCVHYSAGKKLHRHRTTHTEASWDCKAGSGNWGSPVAHILVDGFSSETNGIKKRMDLS